MLKKAIASVQNQTYRDFELIVIDDVDSKGGSWARNQGIKRASGEFIAFLDDDDTWVPDKLALQLKALEHTSPEVGFCFSSVRIKSDYGSYISKMPISDDGNYFENALEHFSGFPTPTLMVKRAVFDDIGYFDERLPSHQESDLMIRMTKKYRGVLISKPLAHVIMTSNHEHIGNNPSKRISGRVIILEKYSEEFHRRPAVLANWYFGLALICRDADRFQEARQYFKKAWQTAPNLRYFMHYLTMVMFGNAKLYKLLKKYR